MTTLALTLIDQQPMVGGRHWLPVMGERTLLQKAALILLDTTEENQRLLRLVAETQYQYRIERAWLDDLQQHREETPNFILHRQVKRTERAERAFLRAAHKVLMQALRLEWMARHPA